MYSCDTLAGNVLRRQLIIYSQVSSQSGRRHQKSKTGVSVSPQKGLMSTEIKKKVSSQYPKYQHNFLPG